MQGTLNLKTLLKIMVIYEEKKSAKVHGLRHYLSRILCQGETFSYIQTSHSKAFAVDI